MDVRRPRRLSFYRRLSPALQREYDRSDGIRTMPLVPSPDLGAAANRVVAEVGSGAPRRLRPAVQALVERICETFPRSKSRASALPAPKVKVLRRRPRTVRAEFHGLYTRFEDRTSEIRVWMFTAAHEQVVKPRTFLRTLLHEVCHHLDMTVLGLPNSIHTPGFHARESSLLRALERSGAIVPGGRRGGAAGAAARRRKPSQPTGVQLELF